MNTTYIGWKTIWNQRVDGQEWDFLETMTRSDERILLELTPNVLLKAYACGIFPMSESADDPNIFWVEPPLRGIIPLNRVHVPRRLQKTIRSGKFEIRVDTDFEAVIDGCASHGLNRNNSWINKTIRKIYGELHELGHCHSVEAWHEGKLAGGLYGLSLNGAFFGESMFTLIRDSSKVALVHLIGRLIHGGYNLLDTQFLTDHLTTFGGIEIPKNRYDKILSESLQIAGNFNKLPANQSGADILDLIRTHTE